MNKYSITLLFVCTLIQSSCNNKRSAEMNWKEKYYDFGRINNGDTVSHIFRFVNSGDSLLKIHNISTSCGCTAAEWTKEYIAPQDSGYIVVRFSKLHDPGLHESAIIVKANTLDPYNVIKIFAEIRK